MAAIARQGALTTTQDVRAVGQLLGLTDGDVLVLDVARLAAAVCEVSLAALLSSLNTAPTLARAICCHVLISHRRVRIETLATRLGCDVRTVRRAVDRMNRLVRNPTHFPDESPLLLRVQQQFQELYP